MTTRFHEEEHLDTIKTTTTTDSPNLDELNVVLNAYASAVTYN